MDIIHAFDTRLGELPSSDEIITCPLQVETKTIGTYVEI